jgi:hypothetical protein
MSSNATKTVEAELLNVLGAAKRLLEYWDRTRDFIPNGEFKSRLKSLADAITTAEKTTGLHATDEG